MSNLTDKVTEKIKIKIGTVVNQDAYVLLVTRYAADGTQEYAAGFTWQKYNDYELLDISNVSFPGRVALEIEDARGQG